MASKTAILSIRIIADGKQAGREFADTNKQVASFDDGLRKASIGAGIAVAGIGALAVAAGNAASDLQQAAGAVESVYGDYAGSVKKMAEDAAENVGLAKSEYMQMSSVLGAQLKNMGIPMGEVADQTADLVTLGADLAATFGGSTSDAVAALSSLMRGERDPIERYGVSIKQADVEARKAQLGLEDLEGAAARAADTQVTLALLTEQTADASGQFAREADTAAGAQQRANAQWQDAQAALGEALLPVMADLATKFSEIASWVGENTELVTIIAGVILGLAGAILIANGAITAYRTVAALAAAAQVVWNLAMTANPIGIVITVIGLLIGAIVLLTTNWEEVGKVAGEVWQNIIGWIQDAIGWVQDALGWIGQLFGAQTDAVNNMPTPGAAAAAPAQARSMAWTTDDDIAVAAHIAAVSSDDGPTASAASWGSAAGAARSEVAAGDTYNITVQGAIDVDGTARTIEDVLAKHARKTGRPMAGSGGGPRWR